MQTLEIKDSLLQIFRDVLDNNSIELEDKTTAADVNGWDSLAHVTLIVAIEKKFKVKFTNHEVNSLQNVGDLIRLIERKLTSSS